MNYSLSKSKCIFIGVILSLAVTGQIFGAAVSYEEYVPAHLDKQIVEDILIDKTICTIDTMAYAIVSISCFYSNCYLIWSSSWIKSVAISPDGSKIVTGSDDRTAKIWNMSDGQLISTLSGHTWGINAVAISPDGSKVVTGSWDRTAKIWNMSDASLITTLPGHTHGYIRLQ